MVGSSVAVISASQREILVATKQLSRTTDGLQESLASGKDVNSAIDNPQNFFNSFSLQNRAADLTRLLDDIGGSVRTVEIANNGLEAMLNLVDQADALVTEALLDLFPRTDETPDQRAIDYIIEKNLDKAYFAEVGNFYTNTTDFVPWDVARVNAENAGLNGVPEVTGHLATITSQAENDVVEALLTATSWLGGSDDEVEGVWRWVVGPEAGEQFWQGLAGGTAVNGAYENWAPGEPNQFFGPGNPENFAHLRADGLWNDLPNNNNLNYIIEWGGDLFVQNPDVNVSAEAMDYRDQYLDLLTQIDRIAEDANYRGIGLLEGDTLETFFNEDRSNSLVTEGFDATVSGLGLTGDNFISKTELTALYEEIRFAKNTLRTYASSLQSDLSIITTRQTFTLSTINNLKAGSDDLIVADQNKLGAELLATSIRERLSVTALSLSAQSSQSVLSLFR